MGSDWGLRETEGRAGCHWKAAKTSWTISAVLSLIYFFTTQDLEGWNCVDIWVITVHAKIGK